MKRTILKYTIFFTFFFALTLFIAYYRAIKEKIPLDYANLNYINSHTIDKWEGKNKVIYVWAVWCGVCKVNLPILKLNNQLFGKIFNTNFISIEEGNSSANEIQYYLQKEAIDFPVIKGDELLLKKLGVYSFPTTIFINTKDEVIFIDSGIINPISYFLRTFFMFIS